MGVDGSFYADEGVVGKRKEASALLHISDERLFEHL